MNLFKKYIWGAIIFVFSVLVALLKLKTYQNKQLKEDNEVVERQLENVQHNGNVKRFEAVQDNMLKNAKEDMKEKRYNKTLKPNSEITL